MLLKFSFASRLNFGSLFFIAHWELGTFNWKDETTGFVLFIVWINYKYFKCWKERKLLMPKNNFPSKTFHMDGNHIFFFPARYLWWTFSVLFLCVCNIKLILKCIPFLIYGLCEKLCIFYAPNNFLAAANIEWDLI